LRFTAEAHQADHAAGRADGCAVLCAEFAWKNTPSWTDTNYFVTPRGLNCLPD
jgi:hypothetical protein